MPQTGLDYEDIAKRLSDKPLIGFGESTHGTHEFFVTKAEVFKILVSRYHFNTLFFESVDDSLQAISDYLETAKGDLEKLVSKLFYVYRVHEVLDLFRWLRENYDKHPVTVIGLDEREYAGTYDKNYDKALENLRDKRMASVIKQYKDANPNTRAMIWAHDNHVAAFMNEQCWIKKNQDIPMGQHLRRWYGKDYYAVSQLFGMGQFSAALIEESGASDHANLVEHSISKIPKYNVEFELNKHLKRPTFLKGPEFGGLIYKDRLYSEHSYGWGVQHSAMDYAVSFIEFAKAYNAAVFFPKATASQPLKA